MIWCAKFNGRKIGAIGIFHDNVSFCYGEDEDSARLNLYERFEHISKLVLVPRETVVIKTCNPGDKIYRVQNGKLIGDIDPRNSAWTVVGGDTFPGFVNCMDASGVRRHLNEGFECIIRQGE